MYDTAPLDEVNMRGFEYSTGEEFEFQSEEEFMLDFSHHINFTWPTGYFRHFLIAF